MKTIEELKNIMKSKIVLCASGIDRHSNSGVDKNVAEAVMNLAKALSYLSQIKEE